jgi:hypothetical protein
VFAASLNVLRVPKEIFEIFVMICVFIIYSLTQSYFSPYFRGFTLTLLDSLLFFKSMFYFIVFASIPANIARKTLSNLRALSYILIASFFLIYFGNLFFNFLDVFDHRFGIPSYSWFFSNPGEFATITFLLHIPLIISASFNPLGILSLIIFFLQITSLRFKAFVIVSITVLLIFLIGNKKKYPVDYTKYLFKRFILASPIIIPFIFFLGFGQFSYYFLSETTPRLLLLKSALSVASDFFPFGSGGGTFGSAIANSNYSVLYDDLGFEGVYGLSSYDTGANFLSDQYWPMILAQYGWMGLILYVYILFKLYKVAKRNLSESPRYLIAFYMIVFSFILSSFGSAVFSGYLGCFFLSLLGLIYASKR